MQKRGLLLNQPISVRWGMATILPLAVSATILIFSLTISVVSILLLKDYVNANLQQKASIFLDGFAGHIAQSRPFDEARTEAALQNALEYQSVLGEMSTAIARADQGRLVVMTYREESNEKVRRELEEALGQGVGTAVFHFENGLKARLTKVYERDGEPFALSTLFDAHEAVLANRTAIWFAIFINAVLVLVSVAVTFFMSRRIAASLRSFTRRLSKSNEPSDYTKSELASLESALAIREEDEAARSKALEELAQAERDAHLARVAAVIAHEVRNPLAGMLSGVSTIRRFGDDPDVREETLHILEGGLKSLEKIANVTLATYRHRGERKVMNVSEIMDLELLISPEARKKALILAWEITGPELFQADADAIRQIMLNLLLNACNASPPKASIEIGVRVEVNEVILSVADHGPGLPPGIVELLTSNPKSEALPTSRGLGVSIIRGIIQDIGGDIAVDTMPGLGSKITVTIPAAPGVDSHAEQ